MATTPPRHGTNRTVQGSRSRRPAVNRCCGACGVSRRTCSTQSERNRTGPHRDRSAARIRRGPQRRNSDPSSRPPRSTSDLAAARRTRDRHSGDLRRRPAHHDRPEMADSQGNETARRYRADLKPLGGRIAQFVGHITTVIRPRTGRQVRTDANLDGRPARVRRQHEREAACRSPIRTRGLASTYAAPSRPHSDPSRGRVSSQRRQGVRRPYGCTVRIAAGKSVPHPDPTQQSAAHMPSVSRSTATSYSTPSSSCLVAVSRRRG